MQIRLIDFQSLHPHNFYQFSRFDLAEIFRVRSAKIAPEKVFGAVRRRNFHAVKFDGDDSF